MAILFGLAVLFLIVVFVSYALGAKGIAGFSISVAKVMIVVFVLLFAATLLASTVSAT